MTIIIYLTANGLSSGGSGYKNRKKGLRKESLPLPTDANGFLFFKTVLTE
jgi:hypothetical protein